MKAKSGSSTSKGHPLLDAAGKVEAHIDMAVICYPALRGDRAGA